MGIVKLDWDSQFFDLEIGLLEAQTPLDLEALQENKFNLVYVFIHQKDFHCFVENEWYHQRVPIDQKVLFHKQVTENVGAHGCSLYDANDNYDVLLGLAIESGHQSRFKLDKNLGDGKFEHMYDVWLRQSLNGALANYVFTYKQAEKIVGFVTLSIKSGKGTIGLIAVAPETRGKGIGNKLLQACESQLFQLGVAQLEVATQLANTGACKFYENNGFLIKNITKIYHIWT